MSFSLIMLDSVVFPFQHCDVMDRSAPGPANVAPKANLKEKYFLWKREMIGGEMNPDNSISFVSEHSFVILKTTDQ